MRSALIVLVLLCHCAASSAAELSAENNANASTTETTVTTPKAPAKPAQAVPRKATVKTEAELSGVTSETSDNFYTRLNFSRNSKPRQFIVKSGYGMQETRTYNAKGAVNRQNVDTYNLDAQYRVDMAQRYKFISAYANVKSRTPAGNKRRSGYYSFAAGVGYKLAWGLDSETSLAAINTYDHDADNHITLVQSVRMKHDLTRSMILDSDVRITRPFANEPLVDSHVNMTYKLTEGLGLRLTYIANNLLAPTSSRSGWDKSLRLSLTFSSSAK